MDLTGIGSIAELASGIIDKIWPDPVKAAEVKLAIQQADQAKAFKEMDVQLAQLQMQADTNKAEAGNINIFVAGWRPFVGWICGSALAYEMIVRPLLIFGAAVAGHPVSAPDLAMGDLLTLLGGMLGFGAMRTYEKTLGVPSGH